MDDQNILSLDSEEALDEVLLLPKAVLYKHSTRCGTSARALLEVERFSLGQREIPVYGIDVIRQRGISDLVARRLEIGHESPQVILVRVCDLDIIAVIEHSMFIDRKPSLFTVFLTILHEELSLQSYQRYHG